MTKEHESAGLRWERAKVVSLWVMIVLLAVNLGAYITMATNPSFNTTIQPGSMVDGAAFTVFTDGSNYFARNGKTAAIDYSGAVFQTVMASVITTVNSAGGGRIALADGVYTASGTVQFKSNIELEGQGPGTVVRAGCSSCTGTLGAFFSVWSNAGTSVNNVTIGGFTIDGRNGTYSGNRAIYMRIAQDVVVHDMLIRNFGSAIEAVRISENPGESPTVQRITVRDSYFLDDDFNAIYTSVSSTGALQGMYVRDNVFLNSGGVYANGPLFFSNVVDLVFTGNRIYHYAAQGLNSGILEINQGQNVTVSNNLIDGRTVSSTKSSGIKISQSFNTIITGNFLVDAANTLFNAAINAWPGNSGMMVISDNVVQFLSNPAAQVNCIVVQQVQTGVTVTGNICHGGNFANVEAGLYIHGNAASKYNTVNNATVMGNSFVNVTQGIILTNANKTTILSNVIDSSNYSLQIGSSTFSLIAWNIFQSPATCVYDGGSGAFNVIQFNDVRLCAPVKANRIIVTGPNNNVTDNFGYP